MKKAGWIILSVVAAMIAIFVCELAMKGYKIQEVNMIYVLYVTAVFNVFLILGEYVKQKIRTAM